MRTQNICKFSLSDHSDALSVHCFIYESNAENLKKERSLQNHRMLLITQGDGLLRLDQAEIPLHTGLLVFGFENERLSLSEGNQLACLYIDFSGTRAQELFRRFGIRQSQRTFDGFGGMIPLWRDTLARATETNIDLAAEGVLLQTLSRMSAEKAERNGVVDEMLRITEDHFEDTSLSITLLSEKLSYNAKYLSHLFKREMGVGYSEYLRDIRVNYARGLLDHGIDSVKNVALLSGFSDPLYFSEVFKKVVGMSPKEYISMQRDPSKDE